MVVWLVGRGCASALANLFRMNGCVHVCVGGGFPSLAFERYLTTAGYGVYGVVRGSEVTCGAFHADEKSYGEIIFQRELADGFSRFSCFNYIDATKVRYIWVLLMLHSLLLE